MRKVLLVLALTSLFMTSCGLFGGGGTGAHGELTGVTKRPKWDNPQPMGMVVIPPGSFHMGQNDQDVNYSQIAQNRQITISAFYMDDTEISNNEYRQFVKAFNDGDSTATTVALTLEEIYPDSNSWMNDFSYTYNEPLQENYFWHSAFDEYPVIGVSWVQAQMFSKFRTKLYNAYRTDKELPPLPRFRLPTEAEWEYASRGGLEHKIYPWDGPYVRNSKGCFLANFKPGRGDYIADNFEYTCPVRSYWPNDYGLYNMPGNVAEWCEDDFMESAYMYAHDLNPVYRDSLGREKRKVIRGGSWKDISYFLSCGTRTFEYEDLQRSFIGFRNVVSIIGRSGAVGNY